MFCHYAHTYLDKVRLSAKAYITTSNNNNNNNRTLVIGFLYLGNHFEYFPLDFANFSFFSDCYLTVIKDFLPIPLCLVVCFHVVIYETCHWIRFPPTYSHGIYVLQCRMYFLKVALILNLLHSL